MSYKHIFFILTQIQFKRRASFFRFIFVQKSFRFKILFFLDFVDLHFDGKCFYCTVYIRSNLGRDPIFRNVFCPLVRCDIDMRSRNDLDL